MLVHVLTMDRADSLDQLLESTENTDYGGYEIILFIHVDKSDRN